MHGTANNLCQKNNVEPGIFFPQSYRLSSAGRLQDAAVAAELAKPPTFWVASFFAWWAWSTATASSTCTNTSERE